jgi:hypothetical protein
MAKLLTDDRENKYIHCDFFAEIVHYPQDEFVAVEGDSYRLGETEKDPRGGWNVPLELAERPQGVAPIHVLHVTGD